MSDVVKFEFMSSRELSEASGKRHADLMRDIRKMEDAWVSLGQRNFALVDYTDSKGELRPMYNLSKVESLYIATKFNDEARGKVILRWEELEKSKQPVLPQTYIAALEALIESKKSEEKLLSENTSLHEALDESEQWISIVRAAMELGISETVFNWRVLKSCSLEAGIEIKTVPCPRFKVKKLYHVSVFKNCYPELYTKKLI